MGGRAHRKQGSAGGDGKQRGAGGDDDPGAQGAAAARDEVDWAGLWTLFHDGVPGPEFFSGRYEAALRDLCAAIHGKEHDHELDFTVRLDRFDAGMIGLYPAVQRELEQDQDERWVERHILPAARRERYWLENQRHK